MITAAINSREILSHNARIEGSHFLNTDAYLSLTLERREKDCYTLDELAEVFNPPMFKRQFCQETLRSVQYFQSSDVPSSSERSPVFIYKGQAEKLGLLVNYGDVLITGFGTIGNVRLVSHLQDGVCYANNVCRVRVSDSSERGYVYAFLSSKYGMAQLNKNASGSVVRYIEAPGIKRTLLPRFPESFQKEVDDLIQESARLREEANREIEEAKAMLESFFMFPVPKNCTCGVSSRDIFTSHNKRFEANYHISSGRYYEDYIRNNFECKDLGEVCESISRPDIFKRYYVANGYMFLGITHIMLAIPQSEKKLSKTKTDNPHSLMVKEGTILIPRSGTIGEVAYATSQHAQKLVSEDVIRACPNNILRGGYVYAFLASRIGKALLQRAIFGSVIQHIESPHLSRIPIPIISQETMSEIDSRVKTYSRNFGQACDLELKAISLVESEIERWSKHEKRD